MGQLRRPPRGALRKRKESPFTSVLCVNLKTDCAHSRKRSTCVRTGRTRLRNTNRTVGAGRQVDRHLQVES